MLDLETTVNFILVTVLLPILSAQALGRIYGNVIIGNGNTIVENGSQLNKTVEKKSALGELFNKVGKIIVNIVSKIKTMFLPRV